MRSHAGSALAAATERTCLRSWSVVDSNGVALTQRRVPQMCKVRAVDLDAGLLRLEAPGQPDLAMALDIKEGIDITRGANVAVCSTKPRQAAQEAEQRASKWLSEFLNFFPQLVCSGPRCGVLCKYWTASRALHSFY